MPLRSDWSDRNCPIARSLDVVGDPWIVLIVRQSLSGARRYEEFRSGLGIADNVLSRRLRGLVEAGLLERSPYLDGSRTRYEYLLTQSGADLLPAINALVLWGEKHCPHPDPAVRMDVLHIACGQISSAPDICSNCGGRLVPEQVAWRKSWLSPPDVPLSGVPASPPDPTRTPPLRARIRSGGFGT